MIKKILTSAMGMICLLPGLLFAQWSDNFSDGDFTANPTWNGDNSSWQIINGQLNSNGPGVTGTVIYLSTASATSSNCQWEFYVNPKTGTTSGNYADVFLTSDSARLSGNNNGYFVRIGGTNDEVSLFLKQGGTSTILIDGTNGFIASSSNNPTKVKVVRSVSDQWDLYADAGGTGTNYILQGSVTDASISGSAYFGVLVKYSATNFNKYFFDDFVVGPIVIDLTPPTVQSVQATSIQTVDVLFSEAVEIGSAQTASNYLVDNGMGNPTQAKQDSANHALVHLVFSTNFTSSVLYTLTASTIQDLNANVISGNNTGSFTYVAPVLPSFKDVVINEIFADPSPQVHLPNAEFIEIYNQSNKTLDLSGWKFKSTSTTGTLAAKILGPSQYLILCKSSDTSLYSGYGQVMGISSWPALINGGTTLYLADNLGTLIDSVQYNLNFYHDAVKQAGGWSMELINPNYTGSCPLVNNWSASKDTSGGTPGNQNSVYSTSGDVTSPFVNNVSVIDSMHLYVCMSESIGSAIGLTTTYSIDNGIGNPAAAVLDTVNTDCVKLTLSKALALNITYGITLINASDCSGNVSGNTPFTFSLGSSSTAKFKDLIINEIFADPSPQVHLPNAEFVELYNRSATAIDLAGWKIKTLSSTIGVMFSYMLMPGTYLTLCSNADTAIFRTFGPTLGLANWPALINGGTSLYLQDDKSNVIDSVKYDLTYYQNTSKQNGGWTLELINPNYPLGCYSKPNWIASVDTMGGTPGTQNSVYSTQADVTAPFINGVSVIDSTHIVVCLSEGVSGGWNNINSYTFNNGMAKPLAVQIDSANVSCLDLTLSSPLTINTIYTITLGNLTDCSGNLVSNVPFSFSNAVLSPLDVQFNEVMADETPVVNLPAYEYVELYNRTSMRVNLLNWTFSAGSSVKVLPSIDIEPDSFVVLTSVAGKAAYGANLPVYALASFPSLVNTGSLLVLKNEKGLVMDTVHYDDTWYQDASKKNGGWSLEKIDPFLGSSCVGSVNWIASNYSDGGTPGFQNSVFATDVTGPVMATYTVTDSMHISLCFNESVDTLALKNISNYSMDHGIGNPASVYISSGYCVNLTLSKPFKSGTTYMIVFSNMKDCTGNIGSNAGNSIDFQAPVANFSKNAVWLDVAFTDASTITPGSITSWDWDFGDGSAHGNAQNPMHTYSTSGNFTVCLLVTASNALTDSVCHTLRVDNVGISEKQANDLQVYPNPSNGMFVIEGKDIKQLSIYNLEGVCVYQMSSILSGRKNIDLQHLPSGVYLMKAGRENSVVQKIITINR